MHLQASYCACHATRLGRGRWRVSDTLRRASNFLFSLISWPPSTGKAYIFADVFDEFTFNVDIPEGQPSQSQLAEEPGSTFEIPLNIFLECLNIFGTAGGSASSKPGRFKAWKKPGDDSDGNESEAELDQEREGNKKGKSGAGRLEQFFGGSDRKTSMRLTYIGPGHPLTLIVWVEIHLRLMTFSLSLRQCRRCRWSHYNLRDSHFRRRTPPWAAFWLGADVGFFL